MSAVDFMVVMAVCAAIVICALVYIDQVTEREYERLFSGDEGRSSYDSGKDWPPPMNNRQSSRWSDLTEEEKRAKFERECG